MQILIGRFLHIECKAALSPKTLSSSSFGVVDDADDDVAASVEVLKALNEACSETVGSSPLYESRWLLQVLSSLFLAFFLFDMLADKVGWLQAIWAPVLMASMPFVIEACVRMWEWKNADTKKSGKEGMFTGSSSLQSFIYAKEDKAVIGMELSSRPSNVASTENIVEVSSSRKIDVFVSTCNPLAKQQEEM